MTYTYKKIKNFNPMPNTITKGSHDKEWIRYYDLSFMDQSVITKFGSEKKAIWNSFYVFLFKFMASDRLFDNTSPVIVEKQGEGFVSLYLKDKTRRSRIDVQCPRMGALAIMHLCKLV